VFPTVVNSGSLFVNGTIAAGSPVTVSGVGSVLGGVGAIGGLATVNAGASFAPGNLGIGTMTINTLSLAGNTTMEISGSPALNDAVLGLTSVTYGGNLVVNNIGGTPAAGAKFTLFSAATRQGSFASVTLPNLPSPLTWTNKLALDGSIEVVGSLVDLTPTNIVAQVVGGNLELSWPESHIGWSLQTQTNALAVGLTTNWFTWPGSETTNAVSIPLDKTNATVFFRLTYP
jgi:hypothetical protein